MCDLSRKWVIKAINNIFEDESTNSSPKNCILNVELINKQSLIPVVCFIGSKISKNVYLDVRFLALKVNHCCLVCLRHERLQEF